MVTPAHLGSADFILQPPKCKHSHPSPPFHPYVHFQLETRSRNGTADPEAWAAAHLNPAVSVPNFGIGFDDVSSTIIAALEAQPQRFVQVHLATSAQSQSASTRAGTSAHKPPGTRNSHAWKYICGYACQPIRWTSRVPDPEKHVQGRTLGSRSVWYTHRAQAGSLTGAPVAPADPRAWRPVCTPIMQRMARAHACKEAYTTCAGTSGNT